MNTKNPQVIVLLVAVVVLFVTIGCALTRPRARVGELRTKSESVGLDGAESVRVEINVAAGELDVGGGANELLEADFSYNVAELEPEVEYSGGTLTVRNPDVEGGVGSWWDLDDYRHEWDLRLNDDVPMEMSVEMGAGSADLELGSLSLTRLDVETGAGEITVDLAGASSLTRLNVELGAGEITVDLSGDWQRDLNADIKGGVGEMTLRLPPGVGVRVDVERGLGEINASGLTEDGDTYTNDAYGQTEAALRIDIKAGLGQINLELAEPVPTEKAFDQQLASQLQAVLDAAVDSPETSFPGAVLHVSSPDLGTWTGAAGLGNIETETSMRPGDKFRAGSLTKPMVSVVILQLVEEGLLDLDDTLPEVLPQSVTAKFDNSDQITVRMLLNHTSGIAEWVTDAVYAEALTNPEKVWEVDELLDIAAAQEPNFPPGKGWAYINTEYTLLGLVIEQATGRSWRAEIRERVIEPLDLENTLLPDPGDQSIPGNYAHGYFFYEGQVFDVSYVDPSMAGAAGGHALVTTATDLARFLDAVLAGELFQNPGTLDEMLAYVDAAEGFEPWAVGYGLGLEVFEFPNGIKGLGHTGGTAGYIAYVVHLPAQDITIAGSWNFPEYFEMYVLLLEILIPEFVMPE